MIRPGLFRIICYSVLFLVMFSACKDTADVQGNYLAESPQETPVHYQKLVLNQNGQGFWAKGDEQVFFKWETKNNKIWLHTKTGGNISGNLIKTEKIEIMLPGTGNLMFKKVSR